MKILVLSDSHSTSLKDIPLSEYDACIHCGDYGYQLDYLKKNQFIFVCGNCDSVGLKHQVIQLFDKKVWITHGDLESVKYGFERLYLRAKEYEADVCLFGHTHLQMCFEEDHILFLNPGSYPSCYAVITEHEIILHQYGEIKTLKYEW